MAQRTARGGLFPRLGYEAPGCMPQLDERLALQRLAAALRRHAGALQHIGDVSQHKLVGRCGVAEVGFHGVCDSLASRGEGGEA